MEIIISENMGNEQTKSPSQVSERAIRVIRLGFAKVRCFTTESYALLASFTLANVMIYNKISIFIIVWIGDNILDFA